MLVNLRAFVGELGKYVGDSGEYDGESGEYVGDSGEYDGESGEYVGELETLLLVSGIILIFNFFFGTGPNLKELLLYVVETLLT